MDHIMNYFATYRAMPFSETIQPIQSFYQEIFAHFHSFTLEGNFPLCDAGLFVSH